MTTDELRAALTDRITEIARVGDAIERSDATSDLLAVLDRARHQLAFAYNGDPTIGGDAP